MAWAVALGLAASLSAQGPRTLGKGGGASGAVSEVTRRSGPDSGLRFPRGQQSFEDLASGKSAGLFEGWDLTCENGLLFSARTAEAGAGGVPGRPGSSRWLRVCDRADADRRNGFRSNPILAPNARDYMWSVAFQLESLDGTGPVFPRLMSQHLGPDGYGDLFGLELAADGYYLVVGALGGDPARARLAGYSGATAPGQWFTLRLGVEFDRGRVWASIDGAAPVHLPLHPRRGVQRANLALAFHGEGPGNAATFCLDDLGIAFGASACEESLVVCFENDDDFVTPLLNGQDLSTPPEFGSLFAISGVGSNRGPAIFDSTPGGPNDPSQDRDLLVGLGNLVILQNDQVPTQAVSGVFDHPNDDQDGGTVTFAFTRPLEVLGLDLVDIDQGPVQRATVTLTDGNGKKRVYSVPNGWTEDRLVNGPPGYRTLDTTTLQPQAGFTSSATAVEDAGFEPDSVVRLAVQFGSSGALDNLELRLPCVLLDFEQEDDGTPLVNGQDISTPPEFGTLVSITSSGPNAGAAIFDSSPGGPNDPSQDTDLLVGLGNLLILQNNNAATTLVQSVPGIFDRPNDDADGGSLVFRFPAAVEPRRLDLADIDPGLPNSSTVVLIDASGKRRTFTVPAGWTEDLVTHGAPGFRTLDLQSILPQPGFAAVVTTVEDPGFDASRVMELRVNLGSSGGVDNLCYCP